MKMQQLQQIEGLQTVETVADELRISKQGALNLLCRLKKEGHVTVKGGGKQPRIYRITVTKQRKRDLGMFDIINRYSPMKIQPKYDHQVHGTYNVEDAIVDAVRTRSFRILLASLRLFTHVKDWKRLYRISKAKDLWQEVGAMYNIARRFFRVRAMPRRYQKNGFARYKYLIRPYRTEEFRSIERHWKTYIPFNKNDIAKVAR